MEEKAVLILAKADVAASLFSSYLYSMKVTFYSFYPHDQRAPKCAFYRMIFSG